MRNGKRRRRVVVADGQEFEIVWSGGLGLTSFSVNGSAMYRTLNAEPEWDDDEDERLMRHLRAKKARATQIARGVGQHQDAAG